MDNNWHSSYFDKSIFSLTNENSRSNKSENSLVTSIFESPLFNSSNWISNSLKSKLTQRMTRLRTPTQDSTITCYPSIIYNNNNINSNIHNSSYSNNNNNEMNDENIEISVIQRNGQRIYGGPPRGWKGPPPPKGSEIFVGKIPRDCFENELVPLFSKVGQIYEMRLMMDFSGSNRGYMFVLYTSKEEAKRAILTFNNYEIRPGKAIGVVKSVDNRKLWISGIPNTTTADEIKNEMDRQTEGVKSVILYSCPTDKSKTRGYAFVEYETHRAAALARRKLVPGRIFILGQEVDKVDWAEPENDIDDEIMNKVCVLFVRNLSPLTKESQIKETFESLISDNLERVKRFKDYAFVHFSNRLSAELAYKKSQNLIVDGSHWDVGWSKPVDKNIYNARKELTKVLSSGWSSSSQISSNSSLFHGSSSPRKRGAAGIKGLGPPGTSPPRALLQKLVASQQETSSYLGFPLSSIDLLQSLCDNNYWGNPIYQIFSSRLNDEEFSTCKVILPCYPFPEKVFMFSSSKTNEMEIKCDAAQFVIENLYTSFDGPSPTLLLSERNSFGPQVFHPSLVSWPYVSSPPPYTPLVLDSENALPNSLSSLSFN